MGCRIIIVVLLCTVAMFSFAENQVDDNIPFTFLIPYGYDFWQLSDQNIHIPALGAGVLYGKQDLPFAGWIFDSRYMIGGKTAEKPGRGFYFSIQGIIPISIK